VDKLAKAGHFTYLKEQVLKTISPSTPVEEVRGVLYWLIDGVINQGPSSL